MISRNFLVYIMFRWLKFVYLIAKIVCTNLRFTLHSYGCGILSEIWPPSSSHESLTLENVMSHAKTIQLWKAFYYFLYVIRYWRALPVELFHVPWHQVFPVPLLNVAILMDAEIYLCTVTANHHSLPKRFLEKASCQGDVMPNFLIYSIPIVPHDWTILVYIQNSSLSLSTHATNGYWIRISQYQTRRGPCAKVQGLRPYNSTKRTSATQWFLHLFSYHWVQVCTLCL